MTPVSNNVLPAWQPTTSYLGGSMVISTASAGQAASPPNNPDFELGNLTGWVATGTWSVISSGAYTGTYCASIPAGDGTGKTLVNTNHAPVTPGQTFSASCMVNTGTNALGAASGVVSVFWYNSSGTLISRTDGLGSRLVPGGNPNPGGWQGTTVVAIAPNNAAYVAIGCYVNSSGTAPVLVDAFGWSYVTPTGVNAPVYTAVQSGTGISGTTEPTWPTTSGGTVTDGTCVWQFGVVSSVTWRCDPLMQSAYGEPSWPTVPGVNVSDNTCNWQCMTPAITDANCPQSKYVLTASSKIFAGDNDIVRFSATTNPTDWTSEADAGFLGTGLQSYGANPVTALGLYRSNLVVFNSQGLQMWQIDEDPANMSLLDAIPIGTTYQRALSPVNNDLFFLSPQGVRTIGISVASSNLSAGDVGMPIDVIVQAARVWADANGVDPIATYFPSAGQYWLAFPGWPDSGFFQNPGTSQTTNVFVYTMNRVGEVGAWSRYLFPFVIENFCQNGNDLYIRCNTTGQTGSDIVKVDVAAMQDFAGDTHGRAAYFTGVVQWPWLDFGTTGTTKKLDGIDVVATSTGGTASISVGYDQSNTSRMTTPFAIAADTLPGNFIPIALMAPSFSVSISFSSQYDWQIQAVNVYLQDQRVTA